MALAIDPLTLDRTKQCDKDFGCLVDGGEVCCAVTNSLEGKAVFVIPQGEPCRYRIPFGDKVACLCPTRIAIHDRYGR